MEEGVDLLAEMTHQEIRAILELNKWVAREQEEVE